MHAAVFLSDAFCVKEILIQGGKPETITDFKENSAHMLLNASNDVAQIIFSQTKSPRELAVAYDSFGMTPGENAICMNNFSVLEPIVKQAGATEIQRCAEFCSSLGYSKCLLSCLSAAKYNGCFCATAEAAFMVAMESDSTECAQSTFMCYPEVIISDCHGETMLAYGIKNNSMNAVYSVRNTFSFIK